MQDTASEASFKVNHLPNHSPFLSESIFSVKKIQKYLKKFTFRLLITVYPINIDQFSIYEKNQYLMIFFKFFENLQMLSLLWFNSENQKGFPDFWRDLGLARFDNLCASYSKIEYFYYFSIVFIFSVYFLSFILFFQYIEKSKKSEGLVLLIRVSVMILLNILYFPMMVVFVIIFKYSIIQSTYVVEYEINLQSQSIQQFNLFSLVCFGMTYLIAYLYDSMIYENRHKYAKLNLLSRAHSTLNKYRIHLITIFIFLYPILGTTHQEVYRSLYGLSCGVLAFAFFKLQPFYLSVTNSLQISNLSLISIFSLFFEISYLFNNGSYRFFLGLFVSPLLFGLIFYKSLNATHSENYSEADSVYEFERKIRKKIIEGVDREEILKAFAEFYKEKYIFQDALLMIWVSNFCYYQLEDDHLSRIKINAEFHSNRNLETEFQIFKLKQTLTTRITKENKDIHFLNFRMKFNYLMKLDSKLCENLLVFLSQIKFWDSQGQCDTKLVSKISKQLSQIGLEYKNTLKSYPKCVEIYVLYGGFLENIMNRVEESFELNIKKESLVHSSRLIHLKSISYFDPTNGLMIVSGSSKDFSVITYANETVSNILKESTSTIVGNSLSAYIPYPFNINHTKHMRNFVVSCTDPQIKLPLGLFLQNSQGFLVECYIEIKCTALDNGPLFLVLLKERVKRREIAIVDDDGVVLNLSENFSMLLSENNQSLQGLFIDDYLGGLKIEDVKLFKPYKLHRNKRSLYLVKSVKNIKKKIFNVLYLVSDNDEIIEWKASRSDKDSEYIPKQAIEVTEKDTKDDLDQEVKELKYLKKQLFSSKILHAKNKISADTQEIYKHLNLKNDSKSKSVGNYLSNSLLFKQAFRFLWIFKYVSIFILILTVALQISVYAVILNTFVLHDLDYFINVSEISSTLIRISFISRSLSISNKINANEINDLLNCSSQLTTLRIELHQFIENHHSTADFFTNSNSEVFNPLTISLGKNSIYYTIENFINIVNNLNKNYPSANDLNYLIINGIITSQKISKFSNKLIESDLLQVEIKKKFCLNLGILSIIITSASALTTIYFSLGIKKHYKMVWGKLCELSENHQNTLYVNIIKRLCNTHNRTEFANHKTLNTKKNKQKSIKKFAYFPEGICYFTVTIIFYFLIYFKIIPALNLLIYIQKNALVTNYGEKFEIMALNLWTRENLIKDSQVSIDQLFPRYELFKTPQLEVKDFQESLFGLNKFYSNTNFIEIISNKNFADLFDFGYGSIEGLYGLVNNIYLDSLVLQNQDYKNFERLVQSFLEFSEIFTNATSNDITKCVDNFNNQWTIIIISYFLITFVLLYGTFYFMIVLNKVKIDDMKKISELIPIKTV